MKGGPTMGTRCPGTPRGAIARRVVQVAALAAFLALLVATRRPAGDQPSRWLQAFFLIDPLLALLTWLGRTPCRRRWGSRCSRSA